MWCHVPVLGGVLLMYAVVLVPQTARDWVPLTARTPTWTELDVPMSATMSCVPAVEARFAQKEMLCAPLVAGMLFEPRSAYPVLPLKATDFVSSKTGAEGTL